MPEYVTKEAVKQAMRSQPRGILFTEWELDQVPTVDAVEVVHGRWVTDGLGDGERVCSVCKRYALYTHRDSYDQYLTAYCPNCGAKMDGDPK